MSNAFSSGKMIRTVFSDGFITVVDKPAGVDSEHELPLLLAGQLRDRGENDALFTVHRLDRATSGLTVLARTRTAAAGISAAIAGGKVKKRYVALVDGVPEPTCGDMDDLLFYDRSRGRAYVVDRERKGVKRARLTYRALDSDGERSLVEIELLTGRTHQIRVQFASRGMPLYGDRRYGSRRSDKAYLLRSVYLSLPHPATGKSLELFAEHPRTLAELTDE